MKKNKSEVRYTDEEGNEKVLIVKRPTSTQLSNAKVEENKVVARLLNERDENGKPVALVRSQLDDHLRSIGLWNDQKQKRAEELADKINNSVRKLRKGGFKLSEAKDLAISIRRMRNEYNELLAEQRSLDQYTVESQGENAKFDYLVSVCVLDEEGNKVFESVEDYKERGAEPHYIDAATQLSYLMFNLEPDFLQNLPENKFLKKYGFTDEKGRLVNKDGHLVDTDGRLIDEKGRFVDEDGNFVDANGNPVDEDGEPIEEFEPFTDDDGNPVVVEDEEDNSTEG